MPPNISLSPSTMIHLRAAASSESPAPRGTHLLSQLVRANSSGQTTSVSNTAAPAEGGNFSTFLNKLCRAFSAFITWVGSLFVGKSVNHAGIASASGGIQGSAPGGSNASTESHQWDISAAVLDRTSAVPGLVQRRAARVRVPVMQAEAIRRNKLDQLAGKSQDISVGAASFGILARQLESAWKN